jgi:diaminohydroxyphosphoribosylaminopyrimidine deaminase/5-amino-6-(5-phosphoribosylamino)uracil reductase
MRRKAECVSGPVCKDDLRWMRRALVLARRGEGHTRPNPPVGAVVVRRGRVLGEGWHRRAGQPHAEVEALSACREDPRGATLYVTLEPCCTHGRTPPCTDLIIRSGLRRVVVGCTDPNPRHAGHGLKLLRQAGIEVVTGVALESAEALIAPFATRLQTGQPFVTLKLALTLDGRIADRHGASQWITGPAARRVVQALRRRADAVLVGAGTVCADNPSLRCRLPGGAGRLRLVVDSLGRSSPQSQIFTDEAAGDTVVATTTACPQARRTAWGRHGARVWTFRPAAGRVPVRALLRRLGREGIMHLLCEGGGELAGALIRAGAVDEGVFFYAPAVLGDARARSGVAGADFDLARMPHFEVVETRIVGGDVLIRVRRKEREGEGKPCSQG